MNLEKLLEVDTKLLHLINQDFSNPALDPFFIFLSGALDSGIFRYYILPLFLLLIFLRLKKRALLFLFCVGISVGAADAFVYRVLKPSVSRVRPSDRADLKVIVRQPTKPGGYSFPSNHAANIFAGAVVLGGFFAGFRFFFFLYAFLVAYSRVYLGAHFPFDVIAGGAIGGMIGCVVMAAKMKMFGSERNPLDVG